MIVSEILDRVKLLIDHDLTPAQVIANMNELTKKLFRKFPLPDAVCKFPTTATPYYSLPDDCSEDRIRVVTIDGVDYTKVAPETQTPPANFCTVFSGALFISPNCVGKVAYLYYRPRPDGLTASNMSTEPAFYPDYHDLYVYDAAKWIAGIQRDVDLRNNFQAEYDELLKDATKQLKKMGLKRVKETIEW
ncbi:hypothetical protein [Cohnella sp. GbtcB17]|uniref:phage adaptor protein n=1 Tax=Cohnella sp. GbtcB17 TaxID=2824762 RepID=UPI001C30B15C|nr:hypothetical protein [Cohnella sp. GbtcB17]